MNFFAGCTKWFVVQLKDWGDASVDGYSFSLAYIVRVAFTLSICFSHGNSPVVVKVLCGLVFLQDWAYNFKLISSFQLERIELVR